MCGIKIWKNFISGLKMKFKISAYILLVILCIEKAKGLHILFKEQNWKFSLHLKSTSQVLQLTDYKMLMHRNIQKESGKTEATIFKCSTPEIELYIYTKGIKGIRDRNRG